MTRVGPGTLSNTNLCSYGGARGCSLVRGRGRGAMTASAAVRALHRQKLVWNLLYSLPFTKLLLFFLFGFSSSGVRGHGVPLNELLLATILTWM
jgi:hypothetical protein